MHQDSNLSVDRRQMQTGALPTAPGSMVGSLPHRCTCSADGFHSTVLYSDVVQTDWAAGLDAGLSSPQAASQSSPLLGAQGIWLRGALIDYV